MSRIAPAIVPALLSCILLVPVAAVAQPPGKLPRMGLLSPLSSSALASSPYQAFSQGLRELGWVEGENIAIEYRWAEGTLERLPRLAAELVHLKVAVIVTPGTLSTLAAKQATSTIPIVMVALGDPVGTGIVPSLARPGGNITGIALHVAGQEIQGKRLQLLKEAFPNVARVAAPWNPTNPPEALAFEQLQAAAREFGVTLQSLEVRELKEFESAFAAMTRERPDALLLHGGTLDYAHLRHIVDFVAKKRLPAMYGVRQFVDGGGLMSYGPNREDIYRRAAYYVDKILKGANPGELPVEQPTKFELVINMKTAKALGLTIPQSLLIRADQLIE